VARRSVGEARPEDGEGLGELRYLTDLGECCGPGRPAARIGGDPVVVREQRASCGGAPIVAGCGGGGPGLDVGHGDLLQVRQVAQQSSQQRDGVAFEGGQVPRSVAAGADQVAVHLPQQVRGRGEGGDAGVEVAAGQRLRLGEDGGQMLAEAVHFAAVDHEDPSGWFQPPGGGGACSR
jgi:hypothetical protein